ncbi:MAG: hypothetical protein Q8O55_06160 [Dehalococcoidales bacterium]|nr:hypothetical protein [Dehalococcoidales bacterium]
MKLSKKIKAFFKREKATTKVRPTEPAAGGTERKATETSAQEGTKEKGS